MGGIKSTGKWFKNFFSTPKMHKKTKREKNITETKSSEKEIIEDDFDVLH